jgi:hypothetical protein
MSVLAYPRIHFKGKCLINAPTGNNNDVRVNLDNVHVALGSTLAGMSNAEARAWMTEGIQAVSMINKNVHWYLRSGWNYLGDSSAKFQDVAVTAAVGNDGRAAASDPIVGQAVRITGSEGASPVICDVDPSGSALCQLFVGGLSLGDSALGLEAAHDTRAFGRWVLFRNASIYQGEQNYVGAGATWQFAIPGEALKFRETPAAGPTSQVLAELATAARANRGILVQFCFYLARPQITDTDLIVLFRHGCGLSNPVDAFTVGTIGVWEAGDLMTVPSGRLLQAPPACEDPLPSVPIGPAVARVHTDRPVVSLDLITTFPEANYDRPPTRKAYIGPVRLGLVLPTGGPPIAIGEPLPYGNASYEKTGGILDVPYDPECVTRDQLSAGTLVLLAERDPQGPILTEEYSTITVETDDRGVYLDVGQSGDIAILVLKKGRPPDVDVAVSLWEYQYVTYSGGCSQRIISLLEPVRPGSPLEHRVDYPRTVVFPANRSEPLPIRVTALRPGGLVLAFTLDGEPPGDGFPSATAFYAGVRVMPDDDYSSVPAAVRLTWEFVYQNIFRYYHLIFPAMSRIIPFDDQQATTLAAKQGKLSAATDPARWQSTRYMPPTRDLSAGKRKLLVEWSDSLAGKGP